MEKQHNLKNTAQFFKQNTVLQAPSLVSNPHFFSCETLSTKKINWNRQCLATLEIWQPEERLSENFLTREVLQSF